MGFLKRKYVKSVLIVAAAGVILVGVLAGITIIRTWGRTVIQIDIHQNRELILLSTFAEPPQFAIWLENPATKEVKTVFVTHRVAAGDWEGKANVRVALPQWFRQFRGNGNPGNESSSAKGPDMAISGATPKEDYFSIRVEVKPETEWICWIEMNLAGDFNDAFPEFNREEHEEDEFSNGQPALLFRANVRAVENLQVTPVITGQSIWENGTVRVEPEEGITTARDVFDEIRISVSKPKPKLIDKNKIRDL